MKNDEDNKNYMSVSLVTILTLLVSVGSIYLIILLLN